MAKGRMLNKVIILSKKLNHISEGAENLYYRLLVSVDDYGRFHADPGILKGQIYTLRKISTSLIAKRIDELQKIGLIKLYKNNDEIYLEIIGFEKNQKFRSDIKRKEEYPSSNKGLRIDSVTSRNVSERDEKSSVNSTNKNRNRNNNRNRNKNKEREQIVTEIIEYLNEKTERNFSINSKETIGLINGRLKEGYSLENFKYVIDIKVAKWKDDPKMQDYLRPSTLFRPTNFENYLNEKISNGRKLTEKEQRIKETTRKFIERGNSDK